MQYLIAAVALGSTPWPGQVGAWRLAATGHVTEPREHYAATFVDTATIRREGDRISFRLFAVWEENISSGDNSRLLVSANCRDHSFHDLEVSHYKGGRFIEKGVPRPLGKAVPLSALDRAIGAACGERSWLTRVVKDPYSGSRAAFRRLNAGGYWPLDIGR